MLTQLELNDIANKLIIALPKYPQEWPENSMLEIAATDKEYAGYKTGGNFRTVGTHASLEKKERLVVGKRTAKSPIYIKNTPRGNSKRLVASMTLKNYLAMRRCINKCKLNATFLYHAQESRLYKNNEAKTLEAERLSQIIIYYSAIRKLSGKQTKVIKESRTNKLKKKAKNKKTLSSPKKVRLNQALALV